jgi:DNA-binding transcriptional MerR regulator
MARWLIGQLSKEVDMPIATIRFYENCGLIQGQADPGVKSNNYKYYDAGVVKKLKLIRAAKEIGFTLAEIKSILDSWYNKTLTQADRKAILCRKIEELDVKIQQLEGMKALIQQRIQDVEELNL